MCFCYTFSKIKVVQRGKSKKTLYRSIFHIIKKLMFTQLLLTELYCENFKLKKINAIPMTANDGRTKLSTGSIIHIYYEIF